MKKLWASLALSLKGLWPLALSQAPLLSGRVQAPGGGEDGAQAAVSAGTSREARLTPAAPGQGAGAEVGRGQIRDKGRGGGQGKGVRGARARG